MEVSSKGQRETKCSVEMVVILDKLKERLLKKMSPLSFSPENLAIAPSNTIAPSNFGDIAPDVRNLFVHEMCPHTRIPQQVYWGPK